VQARRPVLNRLRRRPGLLAHLVRHGRRRRPRRRHSPRRRLPATARRDRRPAHRPPARGRQHRPAHRRAARLLPLRHPPPRRRRLPVHRRRPSCREVRAPLAAARAHSSRSAALVSLLLLNGLRISEALEARIEGLSYDRGHRVPGIRRKGDRRAKIPLTPELNTPSATDHPPPPRTPSSPPATAPAGSSAADSEPAGPMSTTHICDGATDCIDPCCLFSSHHRLKTHVRGRRLVLDPDGTLHATTPSRVTRTTRPPGMRPPAPDPPNAGSAPSPDDDPPPFDPHDGSCRLRTAEPTRPGFVTAHDTGSPGPPDNGSRRRRRTEAPASTTRRLAAGPCRGPVRR